MNLEQIRAELAKQPDVAEVLGLVADRDDAGRFIFFIRTPFLSFPRFVIGSTDAQLDSVMHRMRCGEECNARRYWALIQEGNR